jgi:hypothetical protein
MKLQRRTLLRGVAGAALALPALEIMNDSRARADLAVPKRYVFAYCGCSVGNNNVELVKPPTVGPGYGINGARAPLAGRQLDAVGRPDEYRLNVDLDFDSVLEDVSIVSGLKIPWDTGNGVPPGGRVVEFHYGPSVTPVTSGMRSLSRTSRPGGPTSDQLVAKATASDEQKSLGREALVYRVQPISYYSSNTNDSGGRISFRNGADGMLEVVESVFSPRQAYESLVLDVGDPEAAKAALLMMRGRRSVLDLVSDSAKRLVAKVGRSDQVRLERHYDELRTLESKLASLEASAGLCTAMDHPGDDPPFGELVTEGNTGEETETNKWSNEELRGRIFTDILTMAFACDLSRVGVLQLTHLKCHMNMYPVSGQLYDMHNGTHNGVGLAHDAIGWGVSHFARLVARLRDTPDFDGASLLDSSALVMGFEGGVGADPESNLASNAHSTENMCMLMAGGGLVAGEHIHLNDVHPARVVLTAMNAAGAELDELGEVSGTLPELLA